MAVVSSITLDGYIQGVIAFLTPHFPEVLHWGHYQRIEKDTPMPAVIVQVEDFQNSKENAPNDGRLCLEMLVSIRLMDNFHKENVRMDIRKLALKIASLINREQFAMPVTPVEINEVSNDPFEREYDAYEVMKIEFVQSGYFGELPSEEWIIPERVFLGISPEIGLAYEDEYVEITEDE